MRNHNLPHAIAAYLRHITSGKPAHRDATPANIMYRAGKIRTRKANEDGDVTGVGEITMLSSTEAGVEMWGGWREILVHTDEAIDRSTATAMLVNHDPNQIAGPLRSTSIEGGELIAKATISREARMRSGVRVADAVEDGSLAGVSIGYTYGEDDYTVDEEARTVTVNKWRLLEISLTPTQADAAAHVVRSMPASMQRRIGMDTRNAGHDMLNTAIDDLVSDDVTRESIVDELAAAAGIEAATVNEILNETIEKPPIERLDAFAEVLGIDATELATAFGYTDEDQARAATTKENAMTFVEFCKARGLDIETMSPETKKAMRKDWKAQERAALDDDDDDDDDDVNSTDAQHIAKRAEDLGLKVSQYVGMTRAKANDAMLADVSERGSGKRSPNSPATIQVDEKEKIRDEAMEGFAQKRSILDITRRFMSRTGDQEAATQSRGQIIEALSAGFRMPSIADIHNALAMKDGNSIRATETTGTLPNLTALVSAKAIVDGFSSYQPIWERIARPQESSDFKNVGSAGVQVGTLAAVPEGTAAPDLRMDDAGATAANEFRAATILITKEALYNDDTDQIMQQFVDIGRTGARTEDKIVQDVLANATFGAGASLPALAFSKARLDAMWALHALLEGPADEVLGIPGQVLIVPPSLFLAASELVTSAQGEATNTPLKSGSYKLTVVPGYYLTNQLDTYLSTSPLDAAAIRLIRHPDYPVPMIENTDAGAVVGRSMRVEFPRAAYITNSKTDQPVGMVKALGA